MKVSTYLLYGFILLLSCQTTTTSEKLEYPITYNHEFSTITNPVVYSMVESSLDVLEPNEDFLEVASTLSSIEDFEMSQSLTLPIYDGLEFIDEETLTLTSSEFPEFNIESTSYLESNGIISFQNLGDENCPFKFKTNGDIEAIEQHSFVAAYRINKDLPLYPQLFSCSLSEPDEVIEFLSNSSSEGLDSVLIAFIIDTYQKSE